MLIETPKAVQPPAGKPRSSRHRWHAVSIVAPARACASAKACGGKRFLSTEAPRLPLPGCDAAVCTCKYRHFTDRRTDTRRTEERGAAPTKAQSERRQSRGRRAVD